MTFTQNCKKFLNCASKNTFSEVIPLNSLHFSIIIIIETNAEKWYRIFLIHRCCRKSQKESAPNLTRYIILVKDRV